MKTRESPPPVHVHVAESTPVHVHMRRSPSRNPQLYQKRTDDTQLSGDGGKAKARKPWIPPGRLSRRKAACSENWQASRGQHQSDSGISPQNDTDEQEEELGAISKTLSVLLRGEESSPLKRTESGAQPREADVLLRALVEAEIDGVAVANQLTALQESVDGLTKDRRVSKLHASSFGRQRELLLEKIEMFDNTNRSLRELLREWREHERESLLWTEERDALKKRLSSSQAENVRLLAKLASKEKEASTLAEHLDFEKDNVKTTAELSKVLDSTRNHLESQLSRKEAEKAHLAAQVQKLQQIHEQQREEIHALRERQRREEQQQERRDQEEVTRLARRAELAEESVGQLSAKLQEKESQLAQALSTSSDWCVRHCKVAAENKQLHEDVSALKIQVTELNSQLHSADENMRTEREELHHLSAENASVKLDNQRLKAQLTSSEETLKCLQSEARRLKASLKKHEGLVEKYKAKLQQVRLESEACCLKLEAAQKEAREAKLRLQGELEQVRGELLARLGELELLPDKLRRTELQLRDAREKADAHERRNLGHNAALCELRHKVEQQGAQLETFQQKNLLLHEDNGALRERLHDAERKLEQLKAENQDMRQVVAAKEASVHAVRQQLDEKSYECGVLSRKLQQTVDDAKRQADDGMARLLSKERVSQSKASDLQTQLSRARAELSQLQRSKDEMERRFQTQLQNMKDSLEKSHSTNRSLQHYVSLLKTSYGNVFGDSSLPS